MIPTILYIFTDSSTEWNCSEWRGKNPQLAFNSLEKNKFLGLHINEFASGRANDLIPAVDLVVIERLPVFSVVDRILEWQSYGKKVVVDLDDAYELMSPDNPAYPFWIQGIVSQDGKKVKLPEAPKDSLVWGVKLTDGVTTPSYVIADDWKKRGMRTHVIRNYVNSEYYANPRRSHGGTATIGWGGSHSHYRSFKESCAVAAIEKILTEYGGVQLALAGGDRRLLSLFSKRVHDKIVIYDHVSHKAWPDLLRTFDIGIAPLFGPYDDRRSYLKIAEYWYMGIPFVASNKPPYQNVWEDEETLGGVLVKNTRNGWYEGLSAVLRCYSTFEQRAQDTMSSKRRLVGLYENAQNIVDEYTSLIKEIEDGTNS